MNRLAVIAGVSLCGALGVGAFVLSGADNTTAAKPQAIAAEATTTKDAANQIASSTEVKSLPPEPPATKKSGSEGYEIKKTFVGVSPRVVKPGARVEVTMTGFRNNSQITIVVAGKTASITTIVVTATKNGNAKVRFNAPKIANAYVVSVTGFNQLGASVNIQKTFKVVSKK
jgi:hypothetical protein